MTLLAFAAERRGAALLPVGAWRLPRSTPLLSIDMSRLHGAQQQTRRTPRLRPLDGTDRQTDGRTHDRFIDPTPHTVRSVSTAEVYGRYIRVSAVARRSGCVLDDTQQHQQQQQPVGECRRRSREDATCRPVCRHAACAGSAGTERRCHARQTSPQSPANTSAYSHPRPQDVRTHFSRETVLTAWNAEHYRLTDFIKSNQTKFICDK